MTRRILVADDDRQMVKTFCDLLRRRGWEAHGVYSGEEAVAAASDSPFQAILMDVRMAGINGVEAFRRIREARPSLPVVLMTAYSTQGLLSEAQRLGVVDVLAKPFPLPKLLALLEDSVSCGVLVVDDDPEFLRTLASVVEARGHRVLLAPGLCEALETLERRTPGVIVLDLKLEDVEPREAVLAIRDVAPSVVLILCSGYPELMNRTLATCPDGWFHAALQKPFDPDRLLRILDETVVPA